MGSLYFAPLVTTPATDTTCARWGQLEMSGDAATVYFSGGTLHKTNHSKLLSHEIGRVGNSTAVCQAKRAAAASF